MEGRELAIAEIEASARRMRRTIVDMALAAGAASAHVGGALSLVDVMATLFRKVVRHDPGKPEWPDRDRVILSKGHGCLGYYAALADAGYLTSEDLATFERTNTSLPGHPVINRPKGIEFSTGSLGMGLSLGIGVALAARKSKRDLVVYVVLGDGECNEGSVWEGAMAAAHFKLGNLVAVIDRNGFQQTGTNADIMSVGDVGAKWRSFGWEVREVNGHSPGELLDAFVDGRASGTPLAVVAHTVKGKGLSQAENNNDWHHIMLTKAQHDTAVGEIGE